MTRLWASIVRLAITLAACAAMAACSGPPRSAMQLGLASGDDGSAQLSLLDRTFETTEKAADETQKLSPRVVPLGQPVPKGGGVRKLGSPYIAAGERVVPREDPDYDQAGVASWYGQKFHGRKTANGEVYDMTALTAAHPTLPLPSYVKVTHLANNRSLIVRVNDRGPFKRNRIIDLSRRAAKLLGIHKNGTGPVRVTYVKPAPLDGNESVEQAYLAAQPWHRAPETRLGAADASLNSPAQDRAKSQRGG